MSREQYTDEGSLRNYRIEIPNMLDDMDLDPYTFRLYAHIKRRAGDGGACTEYTRDLAAHCKMSPGQVSKSKIILVEKGLIEIEEVDTRNGKGHHVTVTDIWLENMQKYRAMKDQKKAAKRVHTVNSTVHTVNASVHGVNATVHTVNNKKEPVEEETIEEAFAVDSSAEEFLEQAVSVFQEVYGDVPHLDGQAEIQAEPVTDMEVWRLTVKQAKGNKTRARAVGTILAMYRDKMDFKRRQAEREAAKLAPPNRDEPDPAVYANIKAKMDAQGISFR